LNSPDKCPRCGVSFELRSKRLHDRIDCDQVLRNRGASASLPAVSPRTNTNTRTNIRTNIRTDGLPATTVERSKDAERKARQRAANPDAYRVYQRDLMRRRRSAEKLTTEG
jgi:hypothetical protein